MNLGLLVLRMVAGLTFAGHGAQKLFGVFGGAGLEKTAAGFDRMGLRPGKLHAPLAGGAELFGGLALTLGLLTPFATAALVGVMTAAVITVHLRNGFWSTNGGFEFNLVLAAAVFALAGVWCGRVVAGQRPRSRSERDRLGARSARGRPRGRSGRRGRGSYLHAARGTERAAQHHLRPVRFHGPQPLSGAGDVPRRQGQRMRARRLPASPNRASS